MECPICGYEMDLYDLECPRCEQMRAEGRPVAQPASPDATRVPTAPPTPAPRAARPARPVAPRVPPASSIRDLRAAPRARPLAVPPPVWHGPPRADHLFIHTGLWHYFRPVLLTNALFLLTVIAVMGPLVLVLILQSGLNDACWPLFFILALFLVLAIRTCRTYAWLRKATLAMMNSIPVPILLSTQTAWPYYMFGDQTVYATFRPLPGAVSGDICHVPEYSRDALVAAQCAYQRLGRGDRVALHRCVRRCLFSPAPRRPPRGADRRHLLVLGTRIYDA